MNSFILVGQYYDLVVFHLDRSTGNLQNGLAIASFGKLVLKSLINSDVSLHFYFSPAGASIMLVPFIPSIIYLWLKQFGLLDNYAHCYISNLLGL